jgi:hypothetical protein
VLANNKHLETSTLPTTTTTTTTAPFLLVTTALRRLPDARRRSLQVARIARTPTFRGKQHPYPPVCVESLGGAA